MGSKLVKGLRKSIKKWGKAPFNAIKAVGRGDIMGVSDSLANAASFGTIGVSPGSGGFADTGTLTGAFSGNKDSGSDFDTTGIDEATGTMNFIDTSVPSLITGADEADELKKRNKGSSIKTSSFLGGVGSNTPSLI